MKQQIEKLTVGQAIAFVRSGIDISLRCDHAERRIRPLDLADGFDGGGRDHGDHKLAITGTRVRQLGHDFDGDVAITTLCPSLSQAALRALGDPLVTPMTPTAQKFVPGSRLHKSAVEFCKLAGLLPAVIIFDDGPKQDQTARHCPVIDVQDIENYREQQARSLTPLGEARVPLAITDHSRIVPFRPDDGRMEHLAILVGEPEKADAPLCRIHSECFTGDLLGSLRCDCGEQLQGAIATMADAGAGVLLYLAQEGRGIGLANKLRAYQLQDRGLDTVEANQHLGFEPDERDFLSAATMLFKLGIKRVRLMSNNPTKIDGLTDNGIEVVERVAHEFAANDHNREYLRTKKSKSGHMLKLDQLKQPTGTSA